MVGLDFSVVLSLDFVNSRFPGRELLRTDERWNPAVGGPPTTPKRRLGAATDPDRHRGLLDGTRGYRDFVYLEILTMIGDGFFGPEPAHELDRFVEPAAALFFRNAGRGELF